MRAPRATTIPTSRTVGNDFINAGVVGPVGGGTVGTAGDRTVSGGGAGSVRPCLCRMSSRRRPDSQPCRRRRCPRHPNRPAEGGHRVGQRRTAIVWVMVRETPSLYVTRSATSCAPAVKIRVADAPEGENCTSLPATGPTRRPDEAPQRGGALTRRVDSATSLLPFGPVTADEQRGSRQSRERVANGCCATSPPDPSRALPNHQDRDGRRLTASTRGPGLPWTCVPRAGRPPPSSSRWSLPRSIKLGVPS